MTEKEFFLSMIRRVVAENSAGEELSNYYYKIGNNGIAILNANLEETCFYFDENGALILYE